MLGVLAPFPFPSSAPQAPQERYLGSYPLVSMKLITCSKNQQSISSRSRTMNNTRRMILSALWILGLLFLLAACGPTISQPQSEQTASINKNFQDQLSPIPSPAAYRCGAWSSNNAPGQNSTIFIYARLVKNLTGISGATANAVVHFKDFDQPLGPQTSDSGGYVTFTLPLQGRQPLDIPATVDVTFSNFPGGTLHCQQAFFTPE